MKDVNFVTKTNGVGSWTSVRKNITIVRLEHEKDSIELRAYFSANDWDNDENGEICSDEGWLTSFKTALNQMGIPEKVTTQIEYSPFNCQGSTYVTLDVPDEFKLL